MKIENQVNNKHILQSQFVRLVMLSVMMVLGLVFITKGVYTLWHWQENVVRMEGQLIPMGGRGMLRR